jgi:hypothetical protein
MFTKGVNMILGRKSFPLGIGYSRTLTCGVDSCKNAMERTFTNAILKIQKNYNIPGFMLDPFSCFAWKGLKTWISNFTSSSCMKEVLHHTLNTHPWFSIAYSPFPHGQNE